MRPASRLASILALIPTLFVFVAEPALARTIRVPTEQPTIAAALVAATSGDVVELACGTYYERNLVMRSGVTVRSATGDPSCVTIDGQLLGRGFLVFLCDARTTFEGLTLKSCTAERDNGRGGGLWVVESSPTIRRCHFVSCVAGEGAAIAAQSGGQLRLEECRFRPNWYGAPAVTINMSVQMDASRCTFDSAPVVVKAGGTVRFTRCTFVRSALSRQNSTARVNVESSLFYLSGATVDSARCCVTNTSITANWKSNVTTADPKFCTPSGPDYFVRNDSPCVQVSGPCAGLIGAFGVGCGTTTPVAVTITSNPADQPVTIDGTIATTPVTRSWYPMSEHYVSVDTTYASNGSSRWRFASWSDGGPRSRYVLVTSVASLAANVVRQHRIRATIVTSNEPGVGGTVAPPDPWADEGVPFTLTAVPKTNSALQEWIGIGPGSYTGTANPIVLTLYAPVTQRAHFRSLGYEFSISASDTDPHVNVAAPTGGFRPLTLWLTCALGGLSAFEAQVTGTLPVLGFVPTEGVLNIGAGSHLLLAVTGCPTGPSLEFPLGTLFVEDVGGDLCLEAPAENPISAVDCASIPGQAIGPGVTGFSSSGDACRTGVRTCDAPPPPRLAQPLAAAVGDASDGLSLGLARPSPFESECLVSFTLPREANAELSVFDVAGRRLVVLADRVFPAGAHEVRWDGRGSDGDRVMPGVYFLRLVSAGEARTQKIVRLGK